METNNIHSSNPLPIVPEEIESVDESIHQYFKTNKKRTLIVIGGTLLLEIAIYILGAQDPVAYMCPLVWPLIEYSSIQSKIREQFMRQFAHANGYTFTKTGEYGTGSLFRKGHSRHARNIVSGYYEGHPIKLYVYTYVVGHGKHSRTYRTTVFSMSFDALLPHILLVSKDDPLDASLSSENSWSIQLEGDFNKYFSLRVPREYEIEALQIFTPSVMVDLIDKARTYSMEIVGTDLYIYTDHVISTKQKLYRMYDLARYCVTTLSPVFRGMKPSMEAMAAHAQMVKR